MKYIIVYLVILAVSMSYGNVINQEDHISEPNEIPKRQLLFGSCSSENEAITKSLNDLEAQGVFDKFNLLDLIKLIWEILAKIFSKKNKSMQQLRADYKSIDEKIDSDKTNDKKLLIQEVYINDDEDYYWNDWEVPEPIKLSCHSQAYHLMFSCIGMAQNIHGSGGHGEKYGDEYSEEHRDMYSGEHRYDHSDEYNEGGYGEEDIETISFCLPQCVAKVFNEYDSCMGRSNYDSNLLGGNNNFGTVYNINTEKVKINLNGLVPPPQENSENYGPNLRAQEI